jgi:hypothetical protein
MESGIMYLVTEQPRIVEDWNKKWRLWNEKGILE